MTTENTRRANADAVFKQLLGADVRKLGQLDDLQAQRVKCTEVIRALVDSGMSVTVVIEMCIAACAFLGDNTGISRRKMADALVAIDVKNDLSMIYTPGGR